MAKPCPVDATHNTKEVSLGGGRTFDFCEHCKEDVDYLARGTAEEAVDENEEDFDDFVDDEEDFAPAHNPFVNPPGFNPVPARNMGTGPQQMVLLNDDLSAAPLVEEILQRAFGKDPMEARYLMQDAHYRGRSVCKFADAAEVARIQAQIEDIKQEWRDRGCPAQHVDNLAFVVEPNPNP